MRTHPPLSTLKASVPSAFVALACVSMASPALAVEGMWLPEQLPELAEELAEQGLELDASELANLSQHPLGAVISLGGCSASFVSAEGLVVTNHHCAVGALQMNSTAEENLLEHGFHAADRAAERFAGPGSRVLVTERMDDVTERVHAVRDAAANDRERFEAMDLLEKQLVAECEELPGRRCSLASYFGGQEYRLIRQLEIEDVRIVFAPPHMVGFYGGDTDNWMWPRHTGDFTFFRAYVGPDGEPAPYSEDNVPFEPEHVLRVSTLPVQEGDFAMVAGYPGRTHRLRSAGEMAHAENVSYPWQIATMESLIELLDARMEEDADAAVKLNGLRFGLANYLKNSQGTLDGYRSSNIVATVQEREEMMQTWLQRQPGEEAAMMELALAELDSVILDGRRFEERDRLLGWMGWGVRLLSDLKSGYRLAQQREVENDLERDSGYQERDWQRWEERFSRTERSFDRVADERVFAWFLARFDELEGEARVTAIDALLEPYHGEDDPYAACAAAVFGQTEMADEEIRMSFLLNARSRRWERSNDPLVALTVALAPLSEQIREQGHERQGAFARLRPVYSHVLQQGAEGPVYPDANSTLRVTFGQVQGYSPRDGVRYEPITTLQGIVEKHQGEDPFDAPQVLLDRIEARDFGPWASEDLDSVVVNFISDLDTTGGNSGSVTMNAQGELIGLLFDGNYEAMASDWLFDRVNTRSIHVSASYILWVLDRVYGAQNVVQELLPSDANGNQ